MMGSVHSSFFSYIHPSAEEPKWSAKVERWYQLDACAYGIVEMYAKLAVSGELRRQPDLMLLASPLASNESDFGFAKTGASSAHRFAHTLPNIRSAPLLQVMGWSGPMLCIQNDPKTLTSALCEAVGFLRAGYRTIWVVGSRGNGANAGHQAFLFQVDAEDRPENPLVIIEDRGPNDLNRSDTLTIRWFHDGDTKPLHLTDGYAIVRKAIL
jgi:hypothetical protein